MDTTWLIEMGASAEPHLDIEYEQLVDPHFDLSKIDESLIQPEYLTRIQSEAEEKLSKGVSLNPNEVKLLEIAKSNVIFRTFEILNIKENDDINKKSMVLELDLGNSNKLKFFVDLHLAFTKGNKKYYRVFEFLSHSEKGMFHVFNAKPQVYVGGSDTIATGIDHLGNIETDSIFSLYGILKCFHEEGHYIKGHIDYDSFSDKRFKSLARVELGFRGLSMTADEIREFYKSIDIDLDAPQFAFLSEPISVADVFVMIRDESEASTFAYERMVEFLNLLGINSEEIQLKVQDNLSRTLARYFNSLSKLVGHNYLSIIHKQKVK